MTDTKEKVKSGRKPIEDKKQPITIYRPKSEIEKWGGSVEVRNKINKNKFTLIYISSNKKQKSGLETLILDRRIKEPNLHLFIFN